MTQANHADPRVLRTPDDCFDDLPDYQWRPRYETIAGIRLARVDEGDGRPVVFVHGEPTWSFIWRNVIPPVLQNGWRCIAPDLAGFGRSDKPVDPTWHSYERHVDLLAELLFERLDLRAATLVLHDWGGPLGLELAVRHRSRIEQIVLMNTGFLTGTQTMSAPWHHFRNHVESEQDLNIGAFVARAVGRPVDPRVTAGYNAPFPDARFKSGPLALPLMVPLRPDSPGAARGRKVLESLRGDRRRKLLLWGQDDQYLPAALAPHLARALNCDGPRLVLGAGHFLQEHSGAQLGRTIADWLARG